MRGAAAAVASMTSSWQRRWPAMPAAMLVMQLSAETFMPMAFATIASGTVDMPTASTPQMP